MQQTNQLTRRATPCRRVHLLPWLSHHTFFSSCAPATVTVFSSNWSRTQSLFFLSRLGRLAGGDRGLKAVPRGRGDRTLPGVTSLLPPETHVGRTKVPWDNTGRDVCLKSLLEPVCSLSPCIICLYPETPPSQRKSQFMAVKYYRNVQSAEPDVQFSVTYTSTVCYGLDRNTGKYRMYTVFCNILCNSISYILSGPDLHVNSQPWLRSCFHSWLFYSNYYITVYYTSF